MFDRLTLAQVVWLFPPAFALHVLEEAPGFTAWVRQHASKRFTQADFYRNNAVGLAIGIVCCALVALVPNRATVFLFFVLALTQAFFNVFFHVGSTLVYGAYSPGLVTALALYLPLTYVLSRLAMREGWLGKASAAAAFLLGAAIHVAVVARQVYFLERRSPNRRVAARSLRNQRSGVCVLVDRLAMTRPAQMRSLNREELPQGLRQKPRGRLLREHRCACGSVASPFGAGTARAVEGGAGADSRRLSDRPQAGHGH